LEASKARIAILESKVDNTEEAEDSEARIAILEVVTRMWSKGEEKIKMLESRLDNQEKLDKELLGSYVESTVMTMLTKGIRAMDTPDPVEREVRKLDVPLRSLIMRNDTQEEGGEGIEEVLTSNLAEITEFCIGEEVGGMLEDNRLALVTIKAHPRNGSGYFLT
jgi:hypothetical protein